MREILFRGKDIKGNWYEGLLAHNIAKDEWYISNKAGIPTAYQIRPETITQYTGLTDKNGVKIFEGDIIQTDDPDEEPAKVFYDEEETEFAVIIDNCYYGLGSNFNETDLTVIGNIHDNPELLWDGDSE